MTRAGRPDPAERGRVTIPHAGSGRPRRFLPPHSPRLRGNSVGDVARTVLRGTRFPPITARFQAANRCRAVSRIRTSSVTRGSAHILMMLSKPTSRIRCWWTKLDSVPTICDAGMYSYQNLAFSLTATWFRRDGDSIARGEKRLSSPRHVQRPTDRALEASASWSRPHVRTTSMYPLRPKETLYVSAARRQAASTISRFGCSLSSATSYVLSPDCSPAVPPTVSTLRRDPVSPWRRSVDGAIRGPVRDLRLCRKRSASAGACRGIARSSASSRQRLGFAMVWNFRARPAVVPDHDGSYLGLRPRDWRARWFVPRVATRRPADRRAARGRHTPADFRPSSPRPIVAVPQRVDRAQASSVAGVPVPSLHERPEPDRALSAARLSSSRTTGRVVWSLIG